MSGSSDAVGSHTVTVSYGTGSATATLIVLTDTTVPHLKGLDGRAVVDAIRQADLVACRPVSPDGIVVSQTPPADTVVLTKSCVVPVLGAASTRTDDRVAVPDVVGRAAGGTIRPRCPPPASSSRPAGTVGSSTGTRTRVPGCPTAPPYACAQRHR